MDAFDYSDEKSRSRRLSASSVINLIAGLLFLAALCVGLATLLIFVNPYSGINLLPPPTLSALLTFPTATPTPRSVLPPTWTPTATLVPTLTGTPLPPTPLPATPTQVVQISPPAPTTPATPGQLEGATYVVQQGNPVPILNISHPELGCNWTGVGGQAIGLNSAPVISLFVQLGGTLNGKVMKATTLTGTASQYGKGGYEFVLGDRPVASSRTLWVQLLNQEMVPISEKVFFDTFSECEKSLILISFNQVR
ncbi:MAG TPA: hypothetical protein VJ436_05670 [Anaerolineales bacterium]|nr:hypothetical protein [Anaerolineales bacterium]